jgi:hypothetical protein
VKEEVREMNRISLDKVSIEKVSYMGIPDCYRVTNGVVDLVVATTIGPRILRYGFVGEENVLGEWPEVSVATPLGEWKPWAGHRLWVAPEEMPRSYAPDNEPVEHEIRDDREIRLVGKVEEETGLQKEIRVSLGDGDRVTIGHRIRNGRGRTAVLAPWAMTIAARGATAIVPQEPFQEYGPEALTPVRMMALWPWTHLGDPRWRFGQRLIRLRADPERPGPTKIGISNTLGWAGFLHDGRFFLKRFVFEGSIRYPDLGCNTELYAAGEFLEVESLGPLDVLDPGGVADHVEWWRLFRDVPDHPDDAAMAATLAPLVGE